MSRRIPTVWLVWGRRGDYSDRTEYAVCWFQTKAEAESCAATLQELSQEWRKIVADDDGPYGEIWDKARLAVGDEQWAPFDDTEYTAFELKKGRL